MADDVTYTSTTPAGPPDGTKQATDQHVTRGHMPIVKLGLSADGSASLVQADSDGVLVNLGANNDVTVAGVATAANQSTANTTLSAIDGHVDGIESSLTSIDGKIPASPATSGKQDTGNTSLSSIDGKTPSLGQALAAASVPVVLPAAQLTTLTPPVAIPTQYELAGNTVHVKKYYTNSGAATDGIVWSPAAGKRWYVTDIFINVSAAATVTLEDDLAGGDSVVWKAELAANSGWSHSFQTPLFSGEDAADLLITTSAGNVYVMVTGYEI